jgi:hypothetical protein
MYTTAIFVLSALTTGSMAALTAAQWDGHAVAAQMSRDYKQTRQDAVVLANGSNAMEPALSKMDSVIRTRFALSFRTR